MKRLGFCLLITSWILVVSGCTRPTIVTVEIFVTTNGGQPIRLASTPVRIVGEDILANALASNLHSQAQIVTLDYDKFFASLPARTGCENIFTDAEGKTTLRNLRADDFIVAQNATLGTESHLWIASVVDAREQRLLLGTHNEGAAEIFRMLSTHSRLQKRVATRLLLHAQRLFNDRDYRSAIVLATISQKLVPSEQSATMLHQANMIITSPVPWEARIDLKDMPASKQPYYIDCRTDSVIIQPVFIKASLEDLQQPTNAIASFLEGVQQRKDETYVVIMARPGSIKTFRTLRKLIGNYQIDVGYDILDTDVSLDWNGKERVLTARGKNTFDHIPAFTIRPSPLATQTKRLPVFFECRGDQVFCINKVELDEKVEQMLSRLSPGMKKGDPAGFIRAIQQNEVGNKYYKVIPSYLLAMMMALEPKLGVSGDDVNSIKDNNSTFQSFLRSCNHDTQYAVFLVRDRSFESFKQARIIADNLGFETGWEMLDENEPIKFGTGGNGVPTQ